MIAPREPPTDGNKSKKENLDVVLPSVDTDNPSRVAIRSGGKRGGLGLSSAFALSGSGGGKDSDQRPRLPFDSLHNEPPTRLTVNLPTTRPMAVITGSGGPKAVVKPGYTTSNKILGSPRQGVVKHNLLRDYTPDPARAPNLPAFCFNADPTIRQTHTQELSGVESLTRRIPNTPRGGRAEGSTSHQDSELQTNRAPKPPTKSNGNTRTVAGVDQRAILNRKQSSASGSSSSSVDDVVVAPLQLGSRGWIQPHPSNIKRRGGVGQSSITDFSTGVIQRVLVFVDAITLDKACVLLNHQWSYALRVDGELSRRRKLFCWSGLQPHELIKTRGREKLHRNGQHSSLDFVDPTLADLSPYGNDSQGILRYIGMNGHKWHQMCRNRNPGDGAACPPVLLACSVLGEDECAPHETNLAKFPKLASITSPVLGEGFQTPAMPYAWVGMDFGKFRVRLTHYTLGTSLDSLDPVPLQWELQGCVSDERDVTLTKQPRNWGECHWIVLDKQTNFKFDTNAAASDTSNSDLGRRSHTFTINPTAVQGRGPLKKIRIVQTGRNSQWGLNLTVGAMELYGQLFKKVE